MSVCVLKDKTFMHACLLTYANQGPLYIEKRINKYGMAQQTIYSKDISFSGLPISVQVIRRIRLHMMSVICKQITTKNSCEGVGAITSRCPLDQAGENEV